MNNITIEEKIKEVENALISILKVDKNNLGRHLYKHFYRPYTILGYHNKKYIIFFGNDKNKKGKEDKKLFKSRFGWAFGRDGIELKIIFNVSPIISPNIIAKVIQDYELSFELFRSDRWFPSIKEFSKEMAEEASDIFANWIGEPDEVAERLAELYMKEHNIINDGFSSKFLPLSIIITEILVNMASYDDECDPELRTF